MNDDDPCGVMDAQYIRRHHRHHPKENQCTSVVFKNVRAPVPLVSCSSDPKSYCSFHFVNAPAPVLWIDFSDVLWGSWSLFPLPHLVLELYPSCCLIIVGIMEGFVELFLSDFVMIQLVTLYQVWSLVRRFDQPQKYKPFVSRCVVKGDLGIGSVREVNVKSGLPATTSTERLELLDDEEHILGIRIVGGDHRLKNYSSIMTVHPKVIDGRPGTVVVESFVVDVPSGNTKDETCYFVKALIRCNLKSLADVSERMAVQGQTEPIEK
ncbi:Abscisic acid receptor PYL9, partial [Cucurbita argyrosperma subsp. argyrosperma]